MNETATDIAHDQRRAVRPAVDRRALLRTPSGQVIETRAFDLSLGGVRVRCSPAAAYALNFEGADLSRRPGPILDLKLALPFADGMVEFHTRAQLVHQHAPAPEICLLGFRFVDIREAERDHLEAYLRPLARAAVDENGL